MKVAASSVHPADSVGALVDGEVELDLLRGNTVRMTAKAASKSLRASRSTVVLMVAMGMVKRGAPSPPMAGVRRWWVLLDPATTKRDLYDAFVAKMTPPRTHLDFDRYLRARELCSIPAVELPPPVVAEAMIPKLLEIGSNDPSEIAAFTPHHPDNEVALQRLVNQGAERALSRNDVPQGARPTDAMILNIAPGLRNAPGTVFDRLFGGEDLARPKDKALRIAYALGPLRQAALLWAHLAAGSRRTAQQIQVGMRRFSLLDRELSSHGADAQDDVAMGKAMEALAFGDAWAHLKPAARATAARMLQSMIRQLRVYAARNDPDGSRGIAAMVPVQHPDRLAFAARVEARYAQLGKIGRAERKARSDRAADRYAEIVDIATLRTEVVVATQTAAWAAGTRLTAKLEMRARRAEGQPVPTGAEPDDGEDFVEFGVPTTVLTPKGKLLPGSQVCWWRVWRERDLWIDIARRQKRVTQLHDDQILRRLEQIEADPDAYTGLVHEWIRCVPEDGDEAIEPWFVTIVNTGVLNAPASLTARQRRLRHRLIVEWNLPAYGASVTGLLNFDRLRNTLWRWASTRNRFVVPLDEFAFAMRFAQLGLNTVDESLCRISEFLQMRQDKAMWPTSRETGSDEVSFMAIPKSSRYDSNTEAVQFQVEQVTFIEATVLAADMARRDRRADGVLPEIVATDAVVGRQPLPQAWIFQAGGRAITCGSMNRFLRFLLANVVDVTYHELRHAAANAARQAGVPEEAIQRLMNHKTIQQTRYYFRRSQAQRVRQQIGRGRRMKARSATKRAAPARPMEATA